MKILGNIIFVSFFCIIITACNDYSIINSILSKLSTDSERSSTDSTTSTNYLVYTEWEWVDSNNRRKVTLEFGKTSFSYMDHLGNTKSGSYDLYEDTIYFIRNDPFFGEIVETGSLIGNSLSAFELRFTRIR